MKRLAETKRQKIHEQGSVSVYLITAAATFVMLSALLIDFSRAAAFRHSAALAMQSGVRSVLSSYDAGFYEKYGLFIRGGEDGTGVLQTVLAGYSSSRKDGVFPYLETEWSDLGVTESRPLADHEVFRRQVLEEMKYKAPVELAVEWAGRFRGAAPALREAAATVDRLERLRQAYDRREAALDKALRAEIEAGEAVIERLRDLVPYPAEALNGRRSAGAPRNMADAALRYADYVAMRRALMAMQEELATQAAAGATPAPDLMLMMYSQTVGEYESGVVRLAAELSEAAVRAETEASGKIAAAYGALREAEAANRDMRTIAEEPDPPVSSGEEAHGNSGETIGTDQLDAMAEIRKSAAQLLRGDDFFRGYAAELDALSAAVPEVARQASQSSARLRNAPGSEGLEAELRNNAEWLQDVLARFAEAYAENGSAIQTRRSATERVRSRDGERRALEKEADSEWAGWSGLSGKLADPSREPEEIRKAFQEADRLSRANLSWNREQNQQASADSLSSEEEPRYGAQRSSGGRDEAMRRSNAWLGALEEAAAGARDALYLSEFAHARLTRTEPADVKRLLEGAISALPLEKQEAEYVLYGLADAAGNIAAAYGEIFAFRLAVRTFEGLIESRGLGHPLLVLAGALAYGIRNAMQDIRLLLERNAVPLSKYLNIMTHYDDYLRLFYLLHGDSAAKLSRFIGVMERRTGLSLSQAYTYASAEGTASLRLWFFPGLMKALGRVGQLGGTVKGNRYVAVFTADSSYQ